MKNDPQSVVVTPEVGSLNLNPSGFYYYASEFGIWANRAHAEMKSFSPVPYYLYCRSIELALKAFLLAKGFPEQRLKYRNLGHDLTAIFAKARTLGLDDLVSVKPEYEAEVSKANFYYSSKGFEYFSVLNAVHAYRDRPDLRCLQEFSDQLLKSLKQPCLDAE